MELSKKQWNLIELIKSQNVNSLSVLGSVQSGKTYSIALGTILYASELHKYDNTQEYNGAIIGWDLDAVKRNIIKPLRYFLKEFGYKENKDYVIKMGNNEKYFQIWNVRFYFFSFNTKISFNKILGGPLIYIWVDESARIYSQLTLQDSFNELPGRQVSYAGHPYKKTIHSYNVEGNERHPYKRKYIDDNKEAIKFTFFPYDNPKLDTKEKLQEVIKTFEKGPLRDQKIFNKWCVAEGRVFTKINKIENLDNIQIKEIGIGGDYGSTNPTTFVPIALAFDIVKHKWLLIRLEVYYHDPSKEGEKPTTAFYTEQFKKFIIYLQKQYPSIPITCNIMDSEAEHFINALYNAGVEVDGAKKGAGSVDRGVQQMQSLFYKDFLYILEKPSITMINVNNEPVYSNIDESLNEFESYQYDNIKSLSTGQNCYVKEMDHSIDGSRYLIQYWQDIGKCPII